MQSHHVRSFGFALLAATSSVSAQLAYYGFDGDTLAPTSAQSAVTAGNLSGGAGLNALSFAEGNPSSGRAVSATSWTLGSFNPAGNDYVEFAVEPKPGFTLTLSGVEVDTRRSGTGPVNWQLRSSLDSFASALGTASPGNGFWTANQNVGLGAAFGNLSGSVTFRIYGYDAGGASGTLRLDNLEVMGTAAAVPEARGLGLVAGLGLLGFGLARRLRSGG